MKQLSSAADIKTLGAILTIWAHPDDESFLCAGIMAAAVRNGQRVVCITATKGEAGSQDEARWPSSGIGEVRRQELNQALECLGVDNHHWMGYIDGTLASLDAGEPVAQLVALIEQYQPDTILTFGRDGITGHPDHVTVSTWVDKAVTAYGKNIAVYQAAETQQKYDTYFRAADEKLNIYFNVDIPKLHDQAACDILFCLDKQLCEQKYQAFAAMPSQNEAMLGYFSQKLFKQAFCTEAFVRARSRG